MVATQTSFHIDLIDMAIQTEGLSSHNKITQTKEIFNDTPSSNDPILIKLGTGTDPAFFSTM